jgi:hypothetical protein
MNEGIVNQIEGVIAHTIEPVYAAAFIADLDTLLFLDVETADGYRHAKVHARHPGITGDVQPVVVNLQIRN